MSLPRLSHLGLGALALMMSAACGRFNKGNASAQNAGPAVASFAAVDQILTDKCAACHSDSDHQPHFIGHEDALKANAKAVYDVLTTTDATKAMPRPRKTTAPLTDQQKATIVAYSKAPDDSFATAIEPILDSNCALCHADSAKTKPHFIGHKDVFDANLTTIVQRITADKATVMPPAASVPLTDAEKGVVLPYLQAQGG